jgi:GntR family transcriptional repressor for pyruvate dehydrogenase complex
VTLGPLQPSPLVEQATARIREQITGGAWPVGTKLPGETTLAATLGVGRSTVREALRALAGAGLVQPRQGAGVFVIATEPAADLGTRLRRAAVTDVYEVRMMVETQAARLAAERRTPADLEALDAALAGRRATTTGSDAEFIDADIALHAAVVAAAHNPVLTDLFAEFAPALRSGLADFLALTRLRAATPDIGDATHAALVAAIRAGDGDEAFAVLSAELSGTLDTMRRAH